MNAKISDKCKFFGYLITATVGGVDEGRWCDPLMDEEHGYEFDSSHVTG